MECGVALTQRGQSTINPGQIRWSGSGRINLGRVWVVPHFELRHYPGLRGLLLGREAGDFFWGGGGFYGGFFGLLDTSWFFGRSTFGYVGRGIPHGLPWATAILISLASGHRAQLVEPMSG